MGTSRWSVDTVHSSAEFSVSHVSISTYRGRFRAMRGTLVLDEDHPEKSSLEAAVTVKSVDVDDPGLMDKLMGEEFFAADKHPELLYQSTVMQRVDAGHWKVQGNLTIRGVTRPVELTVEARGEATNPFARRPMRAFHARGELNRGDFGLKWYVPLDTGAMYLGERVSLDLHIELLKAD